MTWALLQGEAAAAAAAAMQGWGAAACRCMHGHNEQQAKYIQACSHTCSSERSPVHADSAMLWVPGAMPAGRQPAPGWRVPCIENCVQGTRRLAGRRRDAAEQSSAHCVPHAVHAPYGPSQPASALFLYIRACTPQPGCPLPVQYCVSHPWLALTAHARVCTPTIVTSRYRRILMFCCFITRSDIVKSLLSAPWDAHVSGCWQHSKA